MKKELCIGLLIILIVIIFFIIRMNNLKFKNINNLQLLYNPPNYGGE